MKEMKMKEIKFKCCLCNQTFFGYGNNPDPLVIERGKRCCNECNMFVIKERIMRYYKGLPMRLVS